MTALQLNAELFRELSIIAEDESMMQKALKALRRITSRKRVNENIRPMEELDEIIRQGDEDIKNGNYRVISIDDLWK
ncbi:MAG: hypothetical protein IJS63_12545 [Bacteroidaceae bacterium]|nr:hypothetical protein [Bacteroidaceae bacterium]